jgi:hypothetical protein
MAIILNWKFKDGKHAVYRQGSKASALSVVPDETYPSMWRIHTRDGKLSDMANLTRAKDAAASLAMAEYDRETRLERPAEARYSDLNIPEGAKCHPAMQGLTEPSTRIASSM